MGARERMIVATAAVVLALVGTVVGLTLGLRIQPPPNGGSPVAESRSKRDTSEQQAFDSQYRTYQSSAVTTDTTICSQIGA